MQLGTQEQQDGLAFENSKSPSLGGAPAVSFRPTLVDQLGSNLPRHIWTDGLTSWRVGCEHRASCWVSPPLTTTRPLQCSRKLTSSKTAEPWTAASSLPPEAQQRGSSQPT